MQNKIDITIPRNFFQHLILQAFRYALPREFTSASIECAQEIAQYWGIFRFVG